jgi:hypothetical protein
MPMPLPLLQLLFFALIANALYLASALAAARLLGANAEAARLGFGPRLFAFSIGGTKVEVSAVPLVAWVALEGMADAEGPPVGFRAMHPLRRVAVVLGSWVLPALVAVLLIGPGRAAHHLVVALPQEVRVLVYPEPDAWAALWKAYLALSFPAALGVFLARLIAINLLPLPALSGGLALRPLIGWIFPGLDRSTRFWIRWHMIGALLTLLLALRVVYVIYRLLTG